MGSTTSSGREDLSNLNTCLIFQQNGGDFLSQQLSGPDETGDASTIFPSNELEKATKNFDEETIISRGCNGHVYKAILKDNNPVAIKKSMKVGQSQTKQFINSKTSGTQLSKASNSKTSGTQVCRKPYQNVGSLCALLDLIGLRWLARMMNGPVALPNMGNLWELLDQIGLRWLAMAMNGPVALPNVGSFWKLLDQIGLRWLARAMNGPIYIEQSHRSVNGPVHMERSHRSGTGPEACLGSLESSAIEMRLLTILEWIGAVVAHWGVDCHGIIIEESLRLAAGLLLQRLT
ncbi:hypothetical protein Ddye_027147 [Dipteronia dyeriana]|uniref:Uncharacterized protein n=1 Tax=Dipteronia dyeriana TaxID=168575 RepID=A0AAD9TNI9_9ROSI|nr:hypothetical protein Ddye_027147 [Dipteronia dyeriana]